MMDVIRQPSQEEKAQQASRTAEEKFRGESDWVRFYREVLGVNGVVDTLFPTLEQKGQFEKTAEYANIQQMLAKLRERNRIQKHCDELTRVITVRLPQSLHEALRHEAHNHKTSMNKLCISKLLQVIAGELVPSDFERHVEEEEEEKDTLEPARIPATVAVASQPAFQMLGFSTPSQSVAAHHGSPQPAFSTRLMSPSATPDETSFERTL